MTPTRPLLPLGRSIAPPPPSPIGEQVYRWPATLPWVCGATVAAGVVGLAASLYLVFTSATIDDAGRMSVGFVSAVFSGLALVGGIIVLFVAAREARFTFDHLEVRRFGRRPLRLAYSRYDRDWVADCGHVHVVRLIVLRGNTACSLYLPPDWLRDALDEVARIQAEEGWYDPAF